MPSPKALSSRSDAPTAATSPCSGPVSASMDEPTGPSDPGLAAPHHGTEPSSPSDLLTRHPQAIDAEFSAFYRGDLKQLVAFMVVQGARLSDAAEIAQEAMALAYRSWPTIKHPKAWVRRVASRGLARRIASLEEDL